MLLSWSLTFGIVQFRKILLINLLHASPMTLVSQKALFYLEHLCSRLSHRLYDNQQKELAFFK